MNYRMSIGNRKCKNMLIFNLSRESCPPIAKKICYKTCYTGKVERLYPTARRFREENYRLAKRQNLLLLHRLLHTQLARSPVDTVRIHESGDFFSEGYLQMWHSIIVQFPDRYFFGFTKVYDKYKSIIDYLNVRHNVNIINSFIDGELNYGDGAHLAKIKLFNPNIYICPASAKEGAPKCGVDCFYCSQEKGKYPVFHQH